MTETVLLGGQHYTVANYARRTVLMDHYMRDCITRMGIDKVLPRKEETDAEYMARLHGAATGSLLVPRLLGGYLLPGTIAESEWTPALAEKTAASIEKLDTEEDRTTVDDLVMKVAFAFFQHAVGRLKSFQSFFPTTAEMTAAMHTPNPSSSTNGAPSRNRAAN